MAVEKPNPPVFSFKFQGIFNSRVFSELTEHTERKNDNFYKWTDAKFKTIFVNRIRLHPASRAFSHGTYALYREKALHESCQVPVEHARSVAKIHFRNQA